MLFRSRFRRQDRPSSGRWNNNRRFYRPSQDVPNEPPPGESSKPLPLPDDEVIKNLQEKNALLELENERLRKELNADREKADKQNSQKDVLLESSKDYLDTHDQADVTEINSKVDKINNLAEQLATEVSEAVPSTTDISPQLPPEVEATLEGLVGRRLFGLLRKSNPQKHYTPFLVMAACQTAIAREISQAFNHRVPAFQMTEDNSSCIEVLNKLAEQVQDGGEQGNQPELKFIGLTSS